MTEMAVREGGSEVVQAGSAAVQSPLVRWAQEAREAGMIATSLARTSFVPASLRGKPEDVTAAILAGQELGLQPMATLRSMDVIQGTPALRAHAMRGLVQSHGHSVQLVESTSERCVMRGRRRGETEWQQVVWTLQRAGQMGLLQKAEWKKQPQTMLAARATGELCRLIAADALFAMPYNSEELTGMVSQADETGSDDGRLTVADLISLPLPSTAPEVPVAPVAPPQEHPDPWAGVEYPEPEDDEQGAPSWPAVAQPGGGGE